MRFADLDGTLINVYQATTEMTDESGQLYPYTITTLLDKAFGPEGYYAALTANMHTDFVNSPESDAVISAAQARGVPVISGRQMLQWLDSRNSSAFDSIDWSGSTLSFNVTGGANGLTGMLPLTSGTARLALISHGGNSVPFDVQIIKGTQYALFSAGTGGYSAVYAIDSTPPTVVATTPASGATNVDPTSPVKFTFSEPLDPATVTGTAFEVRNASGIATITVSYDSATSSAVLTPTAALQASTGYTATAKAGGVRDSAGNALAADYQVSFTTGAPAKPIVGYNQIGLTTDFGDGNWLNGSRVLNGSTSTSLTSMSVFVRSINSAPENKFQLAIYTDANGSPGTLVASTAQGTLTADAWNTLPISATLAPNAAYWFVYNTNSTNTNLNNMVYDSGSSGQAVYSGGSIPFGTWPSSFGASVFWAGKFSIYAQ
jgi:hypothetical protein